MCYIVEFNNQVSLNQNFYKYINCIVSRRKPTKYKTKIFPDFLNTLDLKKYKRSIIKDIFKKVNNA